MVGQTLVCPTQHWETQDNEATVTVGLPGHTGAGHAFAQQPTLTGKAAPFFNGSEVREIRVYLDNANW